MSEALTRSPWVSYGVLAGFILVCLAVGQWGASVTTPSVRSWYPTLAKPSWTPPDWAFPVVWSILFVLMAVAAWLVWRAAPLARVWPALLAFFVQLALNGLWSYLFFGRQSPWLGLLDIAALWLAIVVTALLFRAHSPAAALLLVPYLLWVSYAAALNIAIWRLNA